MPRQLGGCPGRLPPRDCGGTRVGHAARFRRRASASWAAFQRLGSPVPAMNWTSVRKSLTSPVNTEHVALIQAVNWSTVQFMPSSSLVPATAAIWARVSTDAQEVDNQLPDIERLCRHRSLTITRRYVLSDVSASNGAHREMLARMLADAHSGHFNVLVVWAADRLSRGGIEELLRIIRELRERNVALISIKEPWLSGSDATTELLAAIAAWVAEQESKRRSERVKAGLARRRAQGKPIGGAVSKRGKDKRKRRTDGYVAAWQRRKAAE